MSKARGGVDIPDRGDVIQGEVRALGDLKRENLVKDSAVLTRFAEGLFDSLHKSQRVGEVRRASFNVKDVKDHVLATIKMIKHERASRWTN